MLPFVTRRLMSGVLLVLLLTFLSYLVFELIPVDPACLRVSCGPGSHSTDADLRAADHQLGVDRPVLFQYARFLWRFLRHGSLGTTWMHGISVNQTIADAVPTTASIVAGGVVLLLLLAIPLGCLAAFRPRSPADRGLLAVAVLGTAIHPFVLAIVIRNVLGGDLGIPFGGYCPLTGGSVCGGPVDWASHLVLPWICFALFFLPLYLRMIRVRLLETLSEPYVVTARAKGASETRVIARHVVRNAIGPVLPMVAADAGTALTAAIYIEVIFAAPGLGRLAVEALSGQGGGYDRPLVVGIVATVGTVVVLLSVASDIGAAWLDPRIRARTSSGFLRLPRWVAASPLGRIPKPALAVAALVATAVGAAFIYTSDPPVPRVSLTGPVHTVRVHWNERHFLNGPGLDRIVVGVSAIEFGERGWRVRGSVSNPTQLTLAIRSGGSTIHDNGFALVYTYRSEGFNQLRVLSAYEFSPPLPAELGPGEAWRGTFGGVEAVPPGRQFYVGFGAFDAGANSAVLTSVLTNASAVSR